MQSLNTIHQYLERHSDEIGNRILASYPPLYGADEAPSPLLSRMVRVPYPAQTLAIMATRSNRSRRLFSRHSGSAFTTCVTRSVLFW